MKKKLSKVLAVVLSLAMVLGLAAVDTTAVGQAAKKLKFTKTGKKAVKSGEKRTLKISGTKAKKAKWTVTGTGKQYIKLAKKKGKTNSFTVKENATGTAKVTAKLTKKNKVSVTYTLSCDLTGIKFDTASATANVITGETAKLNLVAVPENAKLPAATYSVWMDAEKKTAADTTKITCAAFETGVEFGAKEQGTYYVVATVEDKEATAVVTVKDRVAVLQAVKQTKLNELDVTFDYDCTYIGQNLDAFNIVNSDNVRINVGEIKYDAKDKTKATLITLQSMDDGKKVSVTYAGSVVEFTASNGEVSEIDLNTKQAPLNTKVDLKAVYTDANGVIVKEVKLGDRSNEKFEVQAEGTGEAVVDDANGQISMKNLTDTVKVTVYYRSGKFDTVTNEQIVKEQTFEVKAIAEVKMSTVKEYTIANEKDDDDFKYTDLNADQKDIHKIRVDVNAENQKELFAHVYDDLGYEKVNGSFTAAGYKLSSADDTILQVDGDLLQGNRGGDTYVLVSNEEGKVLLTIPVKVEDTEKLKTFKVDTTSIVLSAGNRALPDDRHANQGTEAAWEPDSKTLKITAINQYDEPFAFDGVEVSFDDAASSVDTNRDYVDWGTANYDPDDKCYYVSVKVSKRLEDKDYDKKNGVVDCLKGGKSFTEYYTVTLKDKNFYNTVEKNVGVTTKQPNYSSVNKIKLEAEYSSTIDTTLTNSDNKRLNNDGQFRNVMVALYAGDVFVAYDYITNNKANVTVTKNGKKLDNAFVINEQAPAIDKDTANITLGALYFTTASAIDDTRIDKMEFAYRTWEHVTAASLSTKVGYKKNPTPAANTHMIRVIKKTDATRYTIKVSKIKLVPSAELKTISQGSFLTGTSLVTYAAKDGDSVTTTITVTDNQAKPTIKQLKKAMSFSSAEEVLINAFRIECTDTNQKKHAGYDPVKISDGQDNEYTGGYAFTLDDKGYKVNETGVSFTKVNVYVPYPSAIADYDNLVYVCNSVAIPAAVKAD